MLLGRRPVGSPEVLRDRCGGAGVQGELAGFADHVVEAQGRHFGGAQAETGQRGDDREVTAAAEGTAIAGGEQSSDVLGLET